MTIQISCFAIREIGTGLYIQSMSKSNRCGTGLKLVDPATQLPRLFETKSAAVNAMQYWVMGRWRQSYDSEDGYGMPEPPDRADARTNKLEVVIIKLELKDI